MKMLEAEPSRHHFGWPGTLTAAVTAAVVFAVSFFLVSSFVVSAVPLEVSYEAPALIAAEISQERPLALPGALNVAAAEGTAPPSELEPPTGSTRSGCGTATCSAHPPSELEPPTGSTAPAQTDGRATGELPVVPLPDFDPEQLILGGSNSAGSILTGIGIVPTVNNPTPWEIIVPSAQIRADVFGLGLAADGSLGAPDNPAILGWWEGGAAPGERGNVLIDGHRDYQDNAGNVGIGVAWLLANVAVGDPILIRDAEAGVTYRYTVTDSIALPYDDPEGVRFLQTSPRATLTFITCEGSFDSATFNYSLRRIVVAELSGYAPTV